MSEWAKWTTEAWRMGSHFRVRAIRMPLAIGRIKGVADRFDRRQHDLLFDRSADEIHSGVNFWCPLLQGAAMYVEV